jgi:hypothetical protein
VINSFFPDGGLIVIDFKIGSKQSNITKAGICEDIQMNIYCMAVQVMYGKVPVRASLYYLKDDKTIDYIPDNESIAAFKERVNDDPGGVFGGVPGPVVVYGMWPM